MDGADGGIEDRNVGQRRVGTEPYVEEMQRAEMALLMWDNHVTNQEAIIAKSNKLSIEGYRTP